MGYLDYAGLQHLWDKLKEKFAQKSHSHDDRYYTEVEMDGKLEKKSSTDHTHDLNDLVNALGVGNSTTLNDSVQIITQDTNTANQKYYRRSLSVLWNYIKSKADSVYSAIGHNHKIQNLEEYTTRVYDATIVRPADTVLASPQDKDGIATFRKLDKNDVGLENVDNTADKNKNVATAGIATTGVRDYNNANNIIKIGWSGTELDADSLTYVAGYTSDKKIHPASKDGVRSWLGLGDSAYKNTKSRSSKGSTDWTNNATDDAIVPTMSFMAYWDGAYNSNGASNLSYCDRGRFGTIVTKNTGDYAVAGHTHNSIKDIGNNSSDTTFAYSKAGMNYGDYTWLAGWNGYELRAINKNQFAVAGHTHSFINSVGVKNAQTGRNQIYGDVYSYNSNASANTGMPTTYTSTIGFGQGSAGTVEICGEWTGGKGLWSRALRDYQDNWYDWQRIYTENYHPNADHATSADSATTSNGVKDYNDANRTIKIGYAGSGLNTSNLSHIAGFTDNGTKIKDVSKDVLTSWIGLGNYLPLSGGTMSGQIIKSTNGSWIGDRDRAAIRSGYPGDWSYGAVVAMGTKNGYWTIGNLGGDERLIFNYSTDANYNAGNNNTAQVYLPAQAGTIITSATIGSQTVASANSISAYGFYGAIGASSWFHLCNITTNGDSSNTIISVLTGNGYNGGSSQNDYFQIILKDGWQSSASASSAIGVLVLHYPSGSENTSLKVMVRCTEANKCSVYLFLPWGYWNGNYWVSGSYSSWENVASKLSAEPTTGTAQDVRYEWITTQDRISYVKDSNDGGATTFAYSKAGMNYGDYTWLAAWNGKELRAVNKSQFATAGQGVVASGYNYVRFGNGTQICWGYKNEGDRGGTTSFAVAFNNTSYALALTATTESNNAPFITGRYTTSFSYERHGTSYDDVQWIAVGTWK